MVVLRVASFAECQEVSFVSLTWNALGDSLLSFPLSDILLNPLKFHFFQEALFLSHCVNVALKDSFYTLLDVVYLVEEIFSLICSITCHRLSSNFDFVFDIFNYSAKFKLFCIGYQQN